MSDIKTIDAYIAAHPPEIAQRLAAIRALFHKIVPETKESISYDIATFTVGSHRLYISAYKYHIGMYPINNIPEVENELLPFRGKGTKDALHFKHTEPVPMALIEKIIMTKNKK